MAKHLSSISSFALSNFQIITKAHPQWLLDEATIEKMGELMATNNSKLLGMYDELSTFLSIKAKAYLFHKIFPSFLLSIQGSHGHLPQV